MRSGQCSRHSSRSFRHREQHLSNTNLPRSILLSPLDSAEPAKAPTAVLRLPLLLLKREAWLSLPIVGFSNASSPSAVFPITYPPSGGGSTAKATAERAKLTIRMRAACLHEKAIVTSQSANDQTKSPGESAPSPPRPSPRRTSQRNRFSRRHLFVLYAM